MEANTYSLWQGQGFNYLFSLLPKVHVRWVSHWGLSITSSIPPRAHRGRAEPGIAAHFLFAILKNWMQFHRRLGLGSRRIVDEDESRRKERRVVRADAASMPPAWFGYSLSLLISEIHLSHRSPYTPPSPSPLSPSTVKYWLSDNGPLVECIYYASVVDNPPKWASKRWLVDVFSNFSSCLTTTTSTTPHLWSLKPACLSDKQHWTCRTHSVKRWGQDGGDKGQLLMNRQIWCSSR